MRLLRVTATILPTPPARTRGFEDRFLIKQPIREPNQQPRTARKYRKRPGGDAIEPVTLVAGSNFLKRSGSANRVLCEPEHAVVVSAGRDLAFDTEDDVRSDGS
jgi:hypothetical protein